MRSLVDFSALLRHGHARSFPTQLQTWYRNLSRRRARTIARSGFLALVCVAGSATGDTATDLAVRQEELGALRQILADLRRSMDADLAQRDLRQRELATLEQEAGAARAAAARLATNLQGADERTARLRKEIERQERQLSAANRALTTELRVAYLLGREDRLKLLLNVEDPSSLERQLGYHRYLAMARQQQIRLVQEELDESLRLDERLAAELGEQQQLRTRLGAQVQRLERATAERAALLGALEKRIGDQGRELARLESDRLRLEGLVGRLQRLLTETKARALVPTPFPQQRGQLPWPVEGPTIVGYGERRPGELRSQGIVIAASSGDEVRAVHGGRVVFADWLPGYGLVMILDHGGGFLSIYAHNQALYRQVGVEVPSGDIVAAVGDTGGARQEGLYFEIRKSGRPMDPSVWLARR
jgi:septal ring factor EnvC (AmiA/AmiB activator)